MIVALLGLGITAAAAAVSAEAVQPAHHATWSRVSVEEPGRLPEHLQAPEGRTEWRLESLSRAASFERRVLETADGVRVEQDGRSFVLSDPSGDRMARRWLLPHLDPRTREARQGEPLILEYTEGERTDRLWIDTRRVGLGWAHLPSGPREVFLQRALVLRQRAGEAAWVPERLIHRWVDPRAGVVAEVSGPVDDRGQLRLGIDEVSFVEQIVAGGGTFRIFADELDPQPCPGGVNCFSRLGYGYVRGAQCSISGTPCASDEDCPGGETCPALPVSELTTAPAATVGDLAILSSWDFSVNTRANSTDEIASTTTEIASTTTCHFDECGFNVPGAKLGREDRGFSPDPTASIPTITAVEREDRATDTTIWFRGAVRNEGVSGSGVLGEDESRICYTSEGGETRTPQALWRFSSSDGPGQPFYMDVGDAWPDASDVNGGVFQCEKNIFNQTANLCATGTCGFSCELWAYSCSGLAGQQRASVIGEGPVTLPSGHTFNSLLVKSVAEFCVSVFNSCFLAVDQVRTVNYLWEVPYVGTVARLTSETFVAGEDSWSTVAENDIKYGLFPPVSIQVDGVGTDSVDLSWNPGNDTTYIDGYKIYWNTASGSGAAYAFNSESHPGQATIDVGNATATISGLDPDTEYFFTVTSLSDFDDPGSCVNDVCVTNTYESLLFPTQLAGDGTFYPAEVSATTEGGACIPTAEVENLTVNKTGGAPGEIEICWDPAVDPCLEGYDVLGADTPEDPGNFTTLSQTGLTTCTTLNPTETYFLSVTRGSGGTGPL